MSLSIDALSAVSILAPFYLDLSLLYLSILAVIIYNIQLTHITSLSALSESPTLVYEDSDDI